MDVGARDGGVEPHVPELQAVEGVAAHQRNGSGNGRPRIETKVLLRYISATSTRGAIVVRELELHFFRGVQPETTQRHARTYICTRRVGLTPSEP